MNWDRSVVLKTPEEIRIMREAGYINALVLDTVRKMAVPGITTAELDRVAEKVIREHGGIPTFKGYPGPYPYPATLTVSINEELVHGIPGERKLKEGDIISVDCGTTYKGFVADSAFSMWIGKASPKARQLVNVAREAFFKGFEKMVPGNRIGDISSAIQTYVEKFGYQVPREYTGHGVGRKMHESPQVPNYGKPGHGMVLRAGMTLAIEPMILAGTFKTRVLADRWTVVSADGSLTSHFEHSVAITEDGPIILTKLDE